MPFKKAPQLVAWGFIFVFIILSAGCALLFPDRTAPKNSNYHVEPPSAPWHKLTVGEDPNSMDAMKADLAYENPQTGAIISLNSLCRKYSNASLESLTNNLVRGIENREVISRKETMLDGEKALDTSFKGTVDKVDIMIRTVVMAKDSCTFDFIYVVIPKREVNNKGDFDTFLASFKAQ